jgi:hypothetical protein
MKKEILKQIAQLVTVAFGLVAALAWNNAVQAIFKEFFGEVSGIYGMVTYAVVVSVIAVYVAIWIGKLVGKEK